LAGVYYEASWPQIATHQIQPISQKQRTKTGPIWGLTIVTWHSEANVEWGTHCGPIAFSQSSFLVYLFVWLICCCLFWFPAQMPSGQRRILVDFYIDCVVAAGVRFPLLECVYVLVLVQQQISVDKQWNGKRWCRLLRHHHQALHNPINTSQLEPFPGVENLCLPLHATTSKEHRIRIQVSIRIRKWASENGIPIGLDKEFTALFALQTWSIG